MSPSPQGPQSAVHVSFAALRTALKSAFIERDPLIDAALAALVAGQHVLVVGPPGTAKSQLAATLCESIDGAAYFQWLLTRFTTPEELFGPVSLAELERDRYVRLTAGKLPCAHVVFLDEVFKASSAILNTLLTLLNERKFHNGGQVEPAPLISVFGATNELPEEDELTALYDRFLVRAVVDYIEADFRFLKLLTLPNPGASPTVEMPVRLTLKQIEQARAEAAAVDLPGTVLHDMAALRRNLAGRGIIVSDRRWRQTTAYLRAVAWLEGRRTVGVGDLYALELVLWSALEERDEVKAALDEVVAGELSELRKLLFQSRELQTYPLQFPNNPDATVRAALEALTKLKSVLEQANDRIADAGRRGRDLAEMHAIVREITQIHDDVVSTHLKEPYQ